MAFEISQDSTVSIVLERREFVKEVTVLASDGYTWETQPVYSTFTYTLMNNQILEALQGGTAKLHEIEWRGYEEEDTNNIVTSKEGVFNVIITATSLSTGYTTTYRGALQLYR
jgi:hypothetical protein